MNVSSPILNLTPGARRLTTGPPVHFAYRAQLDESIATEIVTLSEALYADSRVLSDNSPNTQITAADTLPEALTSVQTGPQTASERTANIPTATAEPAKIEDVHQQSSYLETERLLLKRGQSASGPSLGWNIACDAQGRLSGEAAALQALGTASRVNATFDTYWQGPATYRRPGAETLTFQLDDIRGQEHGPFYSAKLGRTIVTGSAATSADPDIIAHEQGHAILDSLCRYNTLNSFTASAHEAFADTTALVTALQSAAVRSQVVAAWESGQVSTVASVLGEGALEWRGGQSGTRGGLRDIASPPPEQAETEQEEAHKASLRFSHGVYAALHKLYSQERARTTASATEAFERVCARVSADFVNMLHYLPRQPIISQSDLARALVQANRELHAGQEEAEYLSSLGALLENKKPTA